MEIDDTLWWQGVQLWYNHSYLEALACWEQLLETATTPTTTDGPTPTDTDTYILQQIAKNKAATTSCHSNSRLQHLWYFVAGCLLDAGAFDRAWRFLMEALPSGSENSNSTTLTSLVLKELVSTYDEQGRHRMAATIIERCIQLHLPIPYAHPLQRPGFVYHNLPFEPFMNTIPDWCRRLEEHWCEIRDECLALGHGEWNRVGQGSHRHGAGSHDGSVIAAGAWNEYVLFGSGAQGRGAPRTQRLIRQFCPEAVDLAVAGGGEIIWSVLAPHTKIAPHCGTNNLRYTAHLGLLIPTNCHIQVAGLRRQWQAGKVLVFDDSCEHSVENLSNEERIVLLIRFWNPHMPLEKRKDALEQALECKRIDQLRRYNPPLPIGDSAVEARAFEQTRCVACGRTGYHGIRLLSFGNGRQAEFACPCSKLIH